MHLNIYSRCKEQTTFSEQKKNSGELSVKVRASEMGPYGLGLGFNMPCMGESFQDYS